VSVSLKRGENDAVVVYKSFRKRVRKQKTEAQKKQEKINQLRSMYGFTEVPVTKESGERRADSPVYKTTPPTGSINIRYEEYDPKGEAVPMSGTSQEKGVASTAPSERPETVATDALATPLEAQVVISTSKDPAENPLQASRIGTAASLSSAPSKDIDPALLPPLPGQANIAASLTVTDTNTNSVSRERLSTAPSQQDATSDIDEHVSDLITWTQGLSAEAIHEHDIIP
jgi:hypothetical protein